MSLPPQANWVYDFKTETNSPEENTLKKLIKGIDWV
jgi:coproporphyrinogen III oxidase